MSNTLIAILGGIFGIAVYVVGSLNLTDRYTGKPMTKLKKTFLKITGLAFLFISILVLAGVIPKEQSAQSKNIAAKYPTPAGLQGQILGKWLDEDTAKEEVAESIVELLSAAYIITENPTNILISYGNKWLVYPAVKIENGIYTRKDNYEAYHSDYKDNPIGKWDETKGERVPFESPEDYRDYTVEFFRIMDDGDLHIGAGLKRIKSFGEWDGVTAHPTP